jgi:hypothetical protein
MRMFWKFYLTVIGRWGIHRVELGDGTVPKISRLWKLRGKVFFRCYEIKSQECGS